MKRLTLTLTLAALSALLLASAAQASFGLEKFDVTYSNADGSLATQAGSHPFAMTTSVYFTSYGHPSQLVEGEVKDFLAEQITGLIAEPDAVPRCSTVDFLTKIANAKVVRNSLCPDSTAVGYAATETVNITAYSAIFNLVPPPGIALKLGFVAANTPVTIEVGLKDRPPYNGSAFVANTPQTTGILASVITLWGDPGDPAHDPYRANCVSSLQPEGSIPVIPGDPYPKPPSYGNCTTNAPDIPLLTLPRSCRGPLTTSYATDSWQHPGAAFAAGVPDLADPNWVTGSVLTHDEALPPNPLGMTGCAKLGFAPSITAQPTTKAAASPTGLDFSLDVHDEGLTSPSGIANSDIEKAVVTLPEGFSTNPSIAEGLTTCSEADLARESAKSAPGAGCPDASKIGTVEVETPLLDENVNGSLYIATPYENPFASLLALYIVIKNPTLGIVVRQPLKVESDPVTGRLTTVSEDLPELPFSHFKLHFREGTRSPLASPPGCGTYNAEAVLTPSSGGPPTVTSSAFQIITGPNAGPCPSGALPPFHPGLEAGTLNNAAGHYSPFNLRLSRNDGEQEFTHFSIKLPPGLVGKLAGIPFCPDAAIAAAKARTGPHGGAEELASPSCPAASEVGRTLVGAGVGPSLAYAPGKVYLAGPYHGSALSIAAITAAKVGPFDLGTVVVRQALKVNPETAEVFIDATGSDPIPHIIKGIPVHARDIRAYVDRPDFVLNPTSCERTSTASTVLGSGLDFGSEADDQPVTVTSPFQAADCASLGFAPKLALAVKGASKRGGHPAFKALLTYPKGSYANIAKAQVTLPHSEFLDTAHIKTICTRVQFNAGAVPGSACPAASIYGYAKAITPLLDEPIQGPVFLRSSSHPLPDLVAALHSGKIDVNLVGRVDSVKGGRIRNTFESVPDAPVTSFSLEMQGGKKGLLVNSTDLCKSTNRAIADFSGQNGKIHDFNPVLAPDCKKAKKAHGAKQRQKRSAARRTLDFSW
jgi:hypothetical protein